MNLVDNYMVLEYHQKYGIAIGTPYGMKTQGPKASPAKDQTPHFVVTVSGGYFRKEGNNKSIQSYTHKVRVPVSVFGSISKKEFDPETGTYNWKEQTRQVPIEEAGIMATILKSGILQTKIKKNDPGFYLLRTYEIQSMEPSHPNLRVPLSPYTMNLNELRDYITVNQFPITLSLFPSVQELRQAILNYIEDPNHYETYEVGYKRRNALKSAFAREISTLEMEFEDDEGEPIRESKTAISDL